jgi:hypothetical protein
MNQHERRMLNVECSGASVFLQFYHHSSLDLFSRSAMASIIHFIHSSVVHRGVSLSIRIEVASSIALKGTALE